MKPFEIGRDSNGFVNKFLGGYIQNIWYSYEKHYLTFGLKVIESDRQYYVNIMVFEFLDTRNLSHPNPNYTLVEDAFKKGVPIACVYRKEEKNNKTCNKLRAVYVNFSASIYAEPNDEPVSNSATKVIDFAMIDDYDESPF